MTPRTARPDATRTPTPNAAIIRIWRPEDGTDALAEIVRAVIAAGGTLTARIPAVALTPDDLVAAYGEDW